MPLVRCSAAELLWRVETLGDAVTLRARVRGWCRDHGLSPRLEWELAIVASEAATNIARHAGDGTLAVRWTETPERSVEIEACDQGPGIPDLAGARRDHVSRGTDLTRELPADGERSLGTGLGAIERLTDHLTIQTSPGAGTRLRAIKRV